jgi:hypothetical protein
MAAVIINVFILILPGADPFAPDRGLVLVACRLSSALSSWSSSSCAICSSSLAMPFDWASQQPDQTGSRIIPAAREQKAGMMRPARLTNCKD